MKITEVRVFPKVNSDNKLRAFVNITFDDCFVVRGLKVIEGVKGVFVVMPSRKVKEDEHRDIAHPVTAEFRDYIEQEVLKAYELHLEHAPDAQGLSEDDPFER
ncbi:MAG TPA: septation regulator SpoVG [Candidatus Omnitrophota bacterium]|nr:septation regulator SpoVG [Candidatus Omnitrophota bacterium]HPS37110.1 septation regulator SpoVG [Candidatus Omnitrophota bacterium]